VSPIGRDAILVIMYVETLQTDVSILIDSIIMCLMSHSARQIIFSTRVSLMTLIISLGEIKRKMSKLTITVFIK